MVRGCPSRPGSVIVQSAVRAIRADDERREIVLPSFRRIYGIIIGAVFVTSLLLVVPASADPAFHTQRFRLSPIADAPLTSGAVIDVHAQGPNIYAQERYVLVGAEAGTTYQVTLQIYADPACATLLFPVPTATMTTNAAGNAHGKATFTPQDVEGLPRVTYYIDWEISLQDGPVVYSTGCVPVVLD
jgi:hypothetical protein